MKKGILLVSALYLAIAASAQGVEKPMRTSANASQIYLEVLGSGFFYSINYDGRFAKVENGAGFRIGLSGAGGDNGGYFALPVQINTLIGTRGQYLELGAGATFLSVNDIVDESNGHVVATATIGFRKQPFGRSGLTWRLAFTPFVIPGFGMLPYGGASLGYRF